MALLSRWLGAVLAESGQLVLAAQRAEPVAKNGIDGRYGSGISFGGSGGGTLLGSGGAAGIGNTLGSKPGQFGGGGGGGAAGLGGAGANGIIRIRW
ncbi:hypothetical protein [Kluyvera ascorbata]|uniref:hypothetical protein n=1 Tax=Kluyvera ascorbata TaxID=51288 RepID=UPI0015EFEC56|nr:hypothetical protein [Kluyvera ascorbata]